MNTTAIVAFVRQFVKGDLLLVGNGYIYQGNITILSLFQKKLTVGCSHIITKNPPEHTVENAVWLPVRTLQYEKGLPYVMHFTITKIIHSREPTKVICISEYGEYLTLTTNKHSRINDYRMIFSEI